MEKRMPSRRKPRAAKRRTFDVINPATEKALAAYPILTARQVRTKVEAAREAFRSWSKLDPKERAAYLLRFAEVLRKHKDAYAQTMTLEMGKSSGRRSPRSRSAPGPRSTSRRTDR